MKKEELLSPKVYPFTLILNGMLSTLITVALQQHSQTSHFVEANIFWEIKMDTAYCQGRSPWYGKNLPSSAIFLARLYESTESYCCPFDVVISVSIGITL